MPDPKTSNASRVGDCFPRPCRPAMKAAALAAAVLPFLAGQAGAQGFLSPGAGGLPPLGRSGAAPAQAPAAPPAPPAGPRGGLPSVRLPGPAGVPAAPGAAAEAPPHAEGEAPPAPVQRAALPPSRPVPPPPALPPSEAAERLRAMVDGAASRSPELAGNPARQAAAQARGRSADSITPNPPSLGGGFVTDGLNNRRGGREAELSLSTPLWLPGEGRASRRVADADLSRLTAQGEAQRLAVAGEVREALATVALAQVEVSGAEARLRDARALEADVGRRVRGRDAAETELLTARLDRMEAEITVSERSATLEGLRLAFQALTGMPADAAVLNEAVFPASGPVHPRQAEADRAVAAAEAARRLAGVQVRESPEVGVLARTQRESGSNRYGNEVGLQFRFPFATTARNAPRQANAEAELTDAVAAAANVRRQVEVQAARAKVELDGATRSLGIARQRAGVLRQQRGLAETAFRGGQFGIADVIRVRVLATEAEVAQGRAEIAVRQARSRVNQALGLLP